jgi:ADP-heptose:LPS heptosyltransferase
MATPRILSPYDNLIDYLIEKATPQEILAYNASLAEQERADELTEKHKTGILTADEHEELKQMMEVDLLVGLLKARAAVALRKP